MAVTALMYGQALLKALNKEINWANDSIKVMLCTSSYTPNQDTHAYKADVTDEVSGTGYTAGGATLSGKSATYNASTNQITLSGANTQWANSTISARYAVIYDDTPSSASDKPLLGYVDFGVTQQSSAGTFEIVWNAQGIFQITVA